MGRMDQPGSILWECWPVREASEIFIGDEMTTVSDVNEHWNWNVVLYKVDPPPAADMISPIDVLISDKVTP